MIYNPETHGWFAYYLQASVRITPQLRTRLTSWPGFDPMDPIAVAANAGTPQRQPLTLHLRYTIPLYADSLTRAVTTSARSILNCIYHDAIAPRRVVYLRYFPKPERRSGEICGGTW